MLKLFPLLFSYTFAYRSGGEVIVDTTRAHDTDAPSGALGCPDLMGLPVELNWCAHADGRSYCTMSRNQHLPQYCGSCWAHGALSALADRIKIVRMRNKDEGPDINLSVQHILNCGNTGTCHGGTVAGPYRWIKQLSVLTGSGVSYETSNPYLACSAESKDGFCPYAETRCDGIKGVAYSCDTFPANGGCCVKLSRYPNATVAKYGLVSGELKMMAEIFANGPITCGIDAIPLLKYTGGISDYDGGEIDHVVSVVGWGEEAAVPYWIIRNSWGEYWGEMGFARVVRGKDALRLETECAWALPGTFTLNNFPCYEDGSCIV